MKIVIQRVKEAKVLVNNRCVAEIDHGLLILCGFSPKDSEETLNKMLEKTLRYRIFEDDDEKMNLSLRDVDGGLLLVPQFTLMADTGRGLRPSFSKAAPHELGKKLFSDLMTLANKMHPKVGGGIFGADMKVHLINDGPVTFDMEI